MDRTQDVYENHRDAARRVPVRFILLLPAMAGLLFQYSVRHSPQPPPQWNASTPLSTVLIALGDSAALWWNDGFPAGDSLQVRQGYDIVHQGFTRTGKGDISELVSPYFVCTDCHNTVIEDPDLRFSNPEARLRFAAERSIPFLPGTTLQGVVNRERWYNGDYQEKYGEEAVSAHDDLRKAIQLCADECSQGRRLEEWELNAVLLYLQSISYRLGDLNLSDSTWSRLLRSRTDDDPGRRKELIAELKSYYLQASPATFLPVPNDLERGYELAGNPMRGEAVYRLSCLHCHKPGRVTRFELDADTTSLKRLRSKILRSRESGFYPAIRHGVAPKSDRRQYMPRYTVERLSNQQIEDLRAYVESIQ